MPPFNFTLSSHIFPFKYMNMCIFKCRPLPNSLMTILRHFGLSWIRGSACTHLERKVLEREANASQHLNNVLLPVARVILQPAHRSIVNLKEKIQRQSGSCHLQCNAFATSPNVMGQIAREAWVHLGLRTDCEFVLVQ